ncbi:acyl-CoA thioesterase [Mycolicibacterium mengxianglii]|nr:thioesterase family protein [Mycolicibacterium mengxianglii]
MPLRVRYAECDMQGRAFNAHYLTWADMAHTEALGAVVGDYREMTAAGVDVVVAAAELQFRRPATFDDRLLVQVRFGAPGNTSLQTTFVMVRDDASAEVVAECALTHVCVDTTHYAKRPWPQWFRARLAATVG